MRFKLIFLLLISLFKCTSPADRTGLVQIAKDHGTIGNAQKALKVGSDLQQGVTNPKNFFDKGVGMMKQKAKEAHPVADAGITSFEEISSGKPPFQGVKKAMDLVPPGTLPPGARTGIKIGLDVAGKLWDGENVFKIAGDLIKEYANPVNLVKNVATDLLGGAGKAVGKVVGGIFNFLGCLFGCSDPPIPDDINPLKQGEAAFEKMLSGDMEGAVDTIRKFAEKQGDAGPLIDAYNKATEAHNKKVELENMMKSLPFINDAMDKISPVLELDADKVLKELLPFEKIDDWLNGGPEEWAKKLGIDMPSLPGGLDKLLKDTMNAENLLKAGGAALGLELPFGMDGFLKDPFRSDGPYGPKGLYGINGMYGPDGFLGPNTKVGPFGPNGLFGVNGPNGLNGPFGPNGAFNPMGLLEKGLKQAAPKLPFLHNPLTAKLLENTPFGSKGTHGLNGLFGPNGPYGPFGDFGPKGLFGPNGPFGPNSKPGDDNPIKKWIDKIPSFLKLPGCKMEFKDLFRQFKEQPLSNALKGLGDKLKNLLGDKLDKLKNALKKAKDLFKKIDELKEKIPKILNPKPLKKMKELFEKAKKLEKDIRNQIKKQKKLPLLQKPKKKQTTTTENPQNQEDPYEDIEELKDYVKDKVKQVMTCLEMPPHPGLDALNQVRALPDQFKSILTPFNGIHDTLSSMKKGVNVADQMSNIKSVFGKIEGVENGNYDFLKNSPEFFNAKKFVSGMKMSYDRLSQPPVVLDAVNILGGSGPSISSVSKFMNDIKIGGDGCENKELRKGAKTLNDLVDLLDKTDDVKKNNDVDKLIDLHKKTKEFAKDLKDLDETFKKFKKDVDESEPDRETFKKLQHMTPLIEKSVTGIENLKDLSTIYELRNEVQTIIKSEKTITEVIKYVKDPAQRIVLEFVWKDFRKTSQNLTIITEKIEKLEKTLSEMTEKTVINQKDLIELNGTNEMKEFLYVYIKAAELNFTESVDLRQYKESLKLLDNSTRSRRDIREISDSFTKVERATSSINWNTIHREFSEMPEVMIGVKGEVQALSKEKEKDDSWWVIYLIIGIGCSLLCSSCFILLFFLYRRRRDEEEQPYTCSDWKYSYVQMQDARLDINRMDANGITELYRAVLDKKWYKVQDLLEEGALVDATCGTYLRTALFELVLMKDLEHAKDFLDAGAYVLQPDVSGNYPEQWSDENGFHLLFDQYSKEDQRKRVIPPNTPRPYDILMVNGKYLTSKERKKLPKRIRNKITWGYKPDMDLDKFTHIVVPPKYTEKENTLLLEDDDLFIWKCVASLGNIMPESWIDAILRSPTYIEDDHVHMLIHIEYAGNEHEEALLKLKTDLHMGRPKFLTNTKITILETKDKKEAEKKKEWEEIIKSLGGEVSSKPVPDNEKTLLPYNSLYPYKPNDKKVQNSCWILKYDDSKVKSIWKSDPEKYTLVPFRFLLECIARYEILPIDNTVVPLEVGKSNEPLEAGGSKEISKSKEWSKSKEGSQSKEAITP